MPTPWPHAPLHQLQESGTYFVTAGTYQKRHHFGSRRRLQNLHHELLSQANQYGWQLEAWAVFSNHYHFVAHSPSDVDVAVSLSKFLGQVHRRTAVMVNDWDEQPGRKVWHNYWETLLTFPGSYFARLLYVHHNAVKHGLVAVATDYPWCSARWLEEVASDSQRQMLQTFDTAKVNVLDDYEVYSG